MRALLVAIGFLTRIPVPAAVFDDAVATRRSLAWYPLVGLLIGAVLAVMAWVLRDAPPMLSAALVLMAWIAITGALHLDGLADSADAWVGGLGDRERTLAIMKDPRCGPAGVVALVAVLLVKFAALASIVGTMPAAWLLLPPVLARTLVPLAFLVLPYVRANGLGAALADAPRTALIVVVGTTLIAGLLPGPAAWIAVAVAVGGYACWHRACQRRLGGFTGDTAGALVELCEATTLVALVLGASNS